MSSQSIDYIVKVNNSTVNVENLAKTIKRDREITVSYKETHLHEALDSHKAVLGTVNINEDVIRCVYPIKDESGSFIGIHSKDLEKISISKIEVDL